MVEENFRVISIFKIIIRTCVKNYEFCEKKSEFLPKRYLFIFYIFFYLNEEELIQQVCLTKYIENEVSNSALKNKRRRAKT